MSKLKTDIIISPHYDDAVLSLFHLLYKNPNLKLITVFSGKPAITTYKLWDMVCTGMSSNKTMLKRENENQQVARNLGIIKSVDLGFLEHQYETSSPERFNIMKEKIKSLIDSKTDKVYFPIAFGDFVSHPDHQELRNIGLELIKEDYNIIFYNDFPYINPVKFIANNKIDKLNKNMNLNLKIKVNSLSGSILKLKYETMKQYKSQFIMTNLVSFNRLRRTNLYKLEITLIKD